MPPAPLRRACARRIGAAGRTSGSAAALPAGLPSTRLRTGTKRVSRVEEYTAADGIELSADQIRRLNDLTPATGERHDDANMSAVDR